MKLYSLPFRIIHLSCAFFVFALIPLGFYMKAVVDEQLLISLYDLHKSLGVLILAMVIFRIYLRIKTVEPACSSEHSDLEVFLSKLTHKSLYLLLLVMPISGWLMSNAAGFPVSFFEVLELPNLIEKSEKYLSLFQTIHSFSAFAMITLIMFHAVGALKHHFVDKDFTLKRMSFYGLGKVGGIFIATLASLFFIVSLSLWVSGYGAKNSAHDGAHAEVHASTETSSHEIPSENGNSH